jgi:pimeloyl-ACP methyl ester carboxylesterase
MLLKKPLREFLRMSSDVFVGEKKIKCAHSANGQPNVVFENGFCIGMSCMKYWDSAFLELSKEYSLFAYDRIDDDIVNEKIVDIQTHLDNTIELLRTLLEKKELKAPYVLVGHSLGGLYMQYFALKYPDDVVGMVLVDAVYPQEFTVSEQKSMLDSNIDRIGQAVLNMPRICEKPMFILSATQAQYKKDNRDKVQMVDESIGLQKKYTKLYPFAKQTWIDSGHLIQYEKPDVIVNAINETIKALKEK